MVSDGGWWPLCSTGNEPGGSVAGGTFKQLEDSRESTASRAATAGNIFDRSTWRGSVAPSSGRRWECDVSPPCADRRLGANAEATRGRRYVRYPAGGTGHPASPGREDQAMERGGDVMHRATCSVSA